MTDKQLKHASKFISLLLRHQPEIIGLSLDPHGWASIDELIEKSQHSNTRLSRDLILKIVTTCEKQRFALDEAQQRIRANQGHSIASIELDLPAQIPPDVLFHGTATRFMTSIAQHGLLKQSRQHVHLSAQQDTAFTVATRHGVPVILQIAAKQMHQDGYPFYLSKNHVWLTDSVPIQYIQRMES